MKTNANNQAGNGDKPRPVSLQVYLENYEAIFRKMSREDKWPHDLEPFESEDHDNDSKPYP